MNQTSNSVPNPTQPDEVIEFIGRHDGDIDSYFVELLPYAVQYQDGDFLQVIEAVQQVKTRWSNALGDLLYGRLRHLGITEEEKVRESLAGWADLLKLDYFVLYRPYEAARGRSTNPEIGEYPTTVQSELARGTAGLEPKEQKKAIRDRLEKAESIEDDGRVTTQTTRLAKKMQEVGLSEWKLSSTCANESDPEEYDFWGGGLEHGREEIVCQVIFPLCNDPRLQLYQAELKRKLKIPMD